MKDVDLKDCNPVYRAILDAAKNGGKQTVEYILANVEDLTGDTLGCALIEAARSNNIDIAKIILADKRLDNLFNIFFGEMH
jgi:hypothetical protein